MRYLLKNFIVSIFTCCMTTCVCCANHGTQKAIKERDAYKFTVTDHKGAPISGLELKVVGKEHIKATTDKYGVAKFEDWCPTFHKWAEKNEKGEIRMKFQLTDPKHKRYKTTNLIVTVSYRYSSGCDDGVVLDESRLNKPQKKYIQAMAMRESLGGMAVDGAGNLLFYSVCLQNPKLPANVTGKCVDIFKGVNTQQEPAVALAQAYVDEKVGPGHKIECQTSYTRDHNDDYLACTSSNYNSHVFEFQFDDLTESVDATIRQETLEGLCTLYGGEILPKEGPGAIRCSGRNAIGTKELCSKLNSVSKKFASAATYEKDRSKATSNSYCYVESRMKPAGETLKTYPGLEPTIFQSYQTKFDSSIKVLIGRYVESVLKNDLKSLKCASMTKSWRRGLGVDDIVECTLRVNSNKTESYKIEFVFDDLSEWSDTTSQGDKSKMTCLTNDGTYVAGKCAGVSQEQCNDLGSQFGVKTKFNRELQMCELPDAKRLDDNRKSLDALVAAGSIVLTVVTIVGTGGAAAPAVLVVAAKIGAAASIVNSGVSLYTMDVEDRANSEADNLMVLINNCGCETDCTNGKCKACATCKDCKYKVIYEKLPSVLKNADYDYVDLLEKKLESIKPCIAPEDLNILKKQLLYDLKREGLVKDTLKGIESATGLMSIVAPGGSKNVLTKAAAAQKVSNTKKVKNFLNEAVDVTSKVNTGTSVFQSDSTSTTQPPNQ